MAALKVGPVLGLEGEDLYTVIFSTATDVDVASWQVGGKTANCRVIAETPNSRVWRGEQKMTVPAGKSGKQIPYQIIIDGAAANDRNRREEWGFYVPGKTEEARFTYGSCNGFSSLDLMHKTEEPYRLWQEMAETHFAKDETPFSLLLMGGDQLYADSIWTEVAGLATWNKYSKKEKEAYKIPPTTRNQIDLFFEKLYETRWTDPSMSLMLASIPSVMMWDDHDIFDGWGSFPKSMQDCEVFQYIFETAKKYFETFQIRSRFNKSLLDPDGAHYAFKADFRGYRILALDNRAERTLQQVMSSAQWEKVIACLKEDTKAHLLVLSAVPVVYRDFTAAEKAFDATPWEEELTDDLKDHWRSKNHEGERARLIHWLLENAQIRNAGQMGEKYKTVILSGDVHIGCIGVIHDSKRNCKVHQVVSSGIVHPSPSRLQWIGIMTVTNDNTEFLDEDQNIRISMLTPFASDKYIRQRNFVTLNMGTDKKLWVNWQSEGKDTPCYPIQ
tara:strand:- start:6029 stop:7528 length:1500 start_codon:yes stop_codon:yes gene_type:complete